MGDEEDNDGQGKGPDEAVTVVDGLPIPPEQPPRRELSKDLQATVLDGQGLGHTEDTIPQNALETWTGDEAGAPRADVPSSDTYVDSTSDANSTGTPIETLDEVEEPAATSAPYDARATEQDAPIFADDEIEVLSTRASQDPDLAAVGGEGRVEPGPALTAGAEETLGAYLIEEEAPEAADEEPGAGIETTLDEDGDSIFDAPEHVGEATGKLGVLAQTGESPVVKIGTPIRAEEPADAPTVETGTETLPNYIERGQSRYVIPEQIKPLNRQGLERLVDVAGVETTTMFNELSRLTNRGANIDTLNQGLGYYSQLVEFVGVEYAVKLSKSIKPTFFRDRATAGDKWIETNIGQIVDVRDGDVPPGYTRTRWLASSFYHRVKEQYSEYVNKKTAIHHGLDVDTQATTVTATTEAGGQPSPAAERHQTYKKVKAAKPKKRSGRWLAAIGCGFLAGALVLCAGGLAAISKYVSDPLREYEDLTVTPYTRTEQVTAGDDDTAIVNEPYILEAGQGEDFKFLDPEKPTTLSPTDDTPSFEDNVSELEQILRSGANLQISASESMCSWITYKDGKLTVVRRDTTQPTNYSNLVEAIQGEGTLYGAVDRGETSMHYTLHLQDGSAVGPALKEGTEIADIIYLIVNAIPSDYSIVETGDDDATDDSVTTVTYGEGDPDAAAEILRDLEETTQAEPGIFNGYEPGFDFARRSTQEYKDLIRNYARDTFFVPEGRVINYLKTDKADVFFRRGAEDTTMSAYFYCTGPEGNPKTEKIIFSFTDTESGHRFDYHIFQDGRTREIITDQEGNRTDKRDTDTTNQHYAAIFQYFVNSGEVLDNVPIPDAPIE